MLATLTAAGPSDVIQLSEGADIQDASLMDRAIVLLGERVFECVQRKVAPPDECFCLYPQELSAVRKTYKATVEKHPAWADNVISYVREAKTHAVSFSGLKRQLQKACPGD